MPHPLFQLLSQFVKIGSTVLYKKYVVKKKRGPMFESTKLPGSMDASAQPTLRTSRQKSASSDSDTTTAPTRSTFQLAHTTSPSTIAVASSTGCLLLVVIAQVEGGRSRVSFIGAGIGIGVSISSSISGCFCVTETKHSKQ